MELDNLDQSSAKHAQFHGELHRLDLAAGVRATVSARHSRPIPAVPPPETLISTLKRPRVSVTIKEESTWNLSNGNQKDPS